MFMFSENNVKKSYYKIFIQITPRNNLRFRNGDNLGIDDLSSFNGTAGIKATGLFRNLYNSGYSQIGSCESGPKIVATTEDSITTDSGHKRGGIKQIVINFVLNAFEAGLDNAAGDNYKHAIEIDNTIINIVYLDEKNMTVYHIRDVKVFTNIDIVGNQIQRILLNAGREAKNINDVIKRYKYILREEALDFFITSLVPEGNVFESLGVIAVGFSDSIDFNTFTKSNIIFETLGGIFINAVSDYDLTITWSSNEVEFVNIYLFINDNFLLIENEYPNSNTYTFTKYANIPITRVKIESSTQTVVNAVSNDFYYMLLPEAPTIEKVDETIVMTGDGDIYYTYDLNAEPADPTISSPIYSIPIAYVDGYYKAIVVNSGVVSNITSKQFSSEVVTDYIAYYKLEDNLATTNVIDETTTYNGISNRNTNLLSTVGVKGLANTAFNFDGINDHLYSMIGSLAGKTYSFWFQIANTTGNKSLIFYGTASGGSLGTADAIAVIGSNLRIYCYDGSQKRSTGLTNLTTNTWNHCVCVFVNSGNCLVYLNSLLETTLAVGARWAGGDRHWFGKGSSDDGTGLLTGKLDDIRIYNRAITEDEVMAIYNNEKL